MGDEKDAMIAHLQSRLDERSLSRHRLARRLHDTELELKALEAKFEDASIALVGAMGYGEIAQAGDAGRR